jgi:hypothetical protein
MSLRALLFRRPPEPQTIEIAFDGAVYSVQVRRHRQARRYTLRVQTASRAIVLTMPMRGSLREAKAFAERCGAWIAARLKRLPQAIPFADGLELPLRAPFKLSALRTPGDMRCPTGSSDGSAWPLLLAGIEVSPAGRALARPCGSPLRS